MHSLKYYRMICKYYWRCASWGGKKSSFKWLSSIFLTACSFVDIPGCLLTVFHVKPFHRLFRLNILHASRVVPSVFFLLSLSSGTLCGVFCNSKMSWFWSWERWTEQCFPADFGNFSSISWQCSSSGVICNNAYSQLPSDIKLIETVIIQNKLSFHLRDVFNSLQCRVV